MKLHNAAEFVRRTFASERFFWIMVGFFVLSSVWVATASLYPMAFDEEFHFGLIKIYAAHWLPYGIENTREMAQYGAAASDPSYLFHYLMSFPYRLLHWFGLSQTAIIIWLRLLNVVMVAISLVLYRKALRAANVSKAVAHGAIAAFTLIPILPMMAGQMNYDNALLVMVALSFWLLISITNHVRKHGTLPIFTSLTLIGVMLITMPLKYAFLPIALGMGLWLIWLLFSVIRNHGFHPFKTHLFDSLRSIQNSSKIGLAVLFILGTFFSARYIENFVRYDSPIPSCDAVFDERACMDYGPWGRDFTYKQNLPSDFKPMSFPGYVVTQWVPGMMYRTTYALAGKTNQYQTKQPLPLLWPIASLLTAIGLFCLFRHIKPLLKRWPYMVVVGVVTIVYVGSLALKLYGAYVETGVPVAINGRYLLPLAPFLIAMFAQAILYMARRHRIQDSVVVLLSALLIVMFQQGGGIFTYIVLGESHWFYPGWGQVSHDILHGLLSPITWQYRWF